MNTRILRQLLIATLCLLAIIYAPFHYSWRWNQNEAQYQQGQIIKDDWVGGQVFIPVESWGIGILGLTGLLWAFWRISRLQNTT
jgi:hypothetical protein